MIRLLLLLSPMRYAVLAVQDEMPQLMRSIEPAPLSRLQCVKKDEGRTLAPKGKRIHLDTFLGKREDVYSMHLKEMDHVWHGSITKPPSRTYHFCGALGIGSFSNVMEKIE